MPSIGPALKREVRLFARARFAVGVSRFASDLQAVGPKDTGRLVSGIAVTNRSTTSNIFSADVVSKAKSRQGFDYPSFLNAAPSITPTKAKFLRFNVGGRTVYSKGFTNRHLAWWDKSVTEPIWGDTMQKVWDR